MSSKGIESKKVPAEKRYKKILWFSWKDLKNPSEGGAEVVNEEIIKRLTRAGYEVILLTAGFEGGKPEENVSGYRIIRVGNRWTVYWEAYKYYKQNLVGWADLVIDEMNTVPFFAKYYVKEKNIMFVHQLCRQIWFYQMFFPINIIGFLIEPVYLWLLSDQKVITISESTRNDLMKYGFKKDNIKIIGVGFEFEPVKDIKKINKADEYLMISLGTIREMKRPDQQILAFEIAKKEIPNLKMKIAGAGQGKYFKKVMSMIANSEYTKDIKYLGRVSDEEKITLMQRAHVITVTSVKEGWGLIVTEANSQGTPAVVYNVDGLRDSVQNMQTGLVSKLNSPEALAKEVVKLLKNKGLYDKQRQNAWDWSKEITFDNCYDKFQGAIHE